VLRNWRRIVALAVWFPSEAQPIHTAHFSFRRESKFAALAARRRGNTTLRYLGAVLLVLALSGLAAAQDGIVCRQEFKTSNNCYRLYRPTDPPRGLVVMLPYYGSDANEFSSAALPGLLAKHQRSGPGCVGFAATSTRQHTSHPDYDDRQRLSAARNTQYPFLVDR